MNQETKERCNKANQVLEELRSLHSDLHQMSTDLFSELCRATHFYLRGGFSVTETVKLVNEEIFA